MKRAERIRFERVADSFHIDLKTGRVATRNNPGIVNENVDGAKLVNSALN